MLFSTSMNRAESGEDDDEIATEHLHFLLEYLKFTSAQQTFAGDETSSLSREVASAMQK